MGCNRIAALGILLSVCYLFFSCNDNRESREQESIPVDVLVSIATVSSGQTRASAPITQPQVLDSLIKSIRILVMNNAGVCETYADFNPIRLSNGNTFKILSPLGMKSFILLTNVDAQSMATSPIGKTASQILVTLKADKNLGSYKLYGQAPQLFWSQLNNILVQSGTIPIEFVTMQRIVSQLETSVYKQAYHTDANGNKTTPFAAGYIQRLDSLYIYSISPDINLLGGINNRSTANPKYDLTNSAIASSNWQKIATNQDRNISLSFPTQGQNIRPYLVFVAEVDANNSDFIASPSDKSGPHGGVLRYWSFLLKQHQLTPNKRLLVDISALLGAGSPTPVPPPDGVQVEFNIQVKEWELIADTITGGKDDFLP